MQKVSCFSDYLDNLSLGFKPRVVELVKPVCRGVPGDGN